ncbi:MAG: arsenite methyltransferase [Actinobacteria bacterium]|nr:arsenite methyltransferase [Actinomycetota bacterium]
MEDRDVKKIVREGYGAIAGKGGSCCGPAEPCCCGASKADEISSQIGYSMEELKSVPEGANLGLGCGNPVALASLRKGETVVDLGSGPGLDSFLAANAVGEAGRIIGVDMTHEMLEKARENARKGGYGNVEFRLGEIENLPVADATADAIISNCVINLSPDKERVFREAFRILKPGGRLMVSDIVLEGELPQQVRESAAAYVGCVSGAVLREDYFRMIEEAGFENVEVESAEYPLKMMFDDDTAEAIMAGLDISQEEMARLERLVVSAKIKAVKPA